MQSIIETPNQVETLAICVRTRLAEIKELWELSGSATKVVDILSFPWNIILQNNCVVPAGVTRYYSRYPPKFFVSYLWLPSNLAKQLLSCDFSLKLQSQSVSARKQTAPLRRKRRELPPAFSGDKCWSRHSLQVSFDENWTAFPH